MKKTHFLSIDGLKGIAILSVVFTHIPLVVWYQFIPPALHDAFLPIFGNGKAGVTIFFLTTGFLMGFLYPSPSSPISFYARRYARLLPAFLVMVASLTFFSFVQFHASVVYQKIFVVIAFALVAHFLLKKFHPPRFIYVVLILQALTALWYIFYLPRIPSSVFYINWNPAARNIVTGVVNATLTLPFGKYVDQLDGVYWAVCAELIFYLLYPIIIAPILNRVNRQVSSLGKIVIFITLFPFCYGLFFMGERILNLALVQPQFIIYFIAGAFIGINFQSIKKRCARFQTLFSHPVWIILMLTIAFSSVMVDRYFPINLDGVRWILILMVVPTSLLLITAVSPSDGQKTLLTNPLLTFLGKCSYAIYLSHSLVIHVIENYLHPDSPINGIAIVILALGGSVLLAWILHELVEQPYFAGRKKVSSATEKTVQAKSSRKIVLITSFCLLFIVYLAYKPPLSLFTFVRRHNGKPRIITLTDKPFRQTMLAQENNLGMITTYIKKSAIPNVRGGFVPFKLYMRLYDDKNKMISQSTFLAYQFIENRYHPFGFPPETNSKGRNYQVEYQLSEKSLADEIKILTTESNMISVYFVDKKVLMKNPKLLVSWTINKLKEPFTNPLFWQAMIYISPFLCVLLFYSFGDAFRKRLLRSPV